MILATNVFQFSSVLICVSTYVGGKSISNAWINLKADDISSAMSSPRLNVLSDPSRSGNYTVSFVPLISVIAHYLPTFLKRLQTQEIISARGLNWLLADENICSPNQSERFLVGRFPNPDNNCQFFECAMNLKNLVNCSNVSSTTKNIVDRPLTKRIADVIELKSKVEPTENGQSTSIAIVYKVDDCMSLILHQCSPQHSYSNRLQKCVSHDEVRCPE